MLSETHIVLLPKGQIEPRTGISERHLRCVREIWGWRGTERQLAVISKKEGKISRGDPNYLNGETGKILQGSKKQRGVHKAPKSGLRPPRVLKKVPSQKSSWRKGKGGEHQPTTGGTRTPQL